METTEAVPTPGVPAIVFFDMMPDYVALVEELTKHPKRWALRTPNRTDGEEQ